MSRKEQPAPEPPKTPAPVQSEVRESVHVEVKLPEQIAPDRETYWVGLYPDCPLDQLTAGGVAFAKRTHGLSLNRDTRREEATTPRDGGLVRLSPTELDAVKISLRDIGIALTWRAQGGRSEANASITTLRQGTLPAAWFVWIARVPSNFVPYAGAYRLPPPAATRPSDLAARLAPPPLLQRGPVQTQAALATVTLDS